MGQFTFAEIQNQNRISIASALRMPMTKLFGLSASGFNTGESDLENYNSFVESEIRSQLKHPIKKLLEIGCQILFGYIPHFKISFPSLRVLTALEEEQVSRQKLEKLVILYEQGVISISEFGEMARKEGLITIQTSSSETAVRDMVYKEAKKNHKYIDKWEEGGVTHYEYPDKGGGSGSSYDPKTDKDVVSQAVVNGKQRYYCYDCNSANGLRELAKKTPLIPDKHLDVTENNALDVGIRELEKMQDEWDKTPTKSKALNNRRVLIDEDGIRHLEDINRWQKRDIEEIVKRVSLIPYIKDIIENGEKATITEENGGLYSYSLIGQGVVNNEKLMIEVILREDKNNKDLLYFSVFDKGIIKNRNSQSPYSNKTECEALLPLVDYFYLNNDTTTNNKSQVKIYKIYKKAK